jgi:hypothetical protein
LKLYYIDDTAAIYREIVDNIKEENLFVGVNVISTGKEASFGNTEFSLYPSSLPLPLLHSSSMSIVLVVKNVRTNKEIDMNNTEVNIIVTH